ncbi:MAG: DUF167 domain-containing protein [Terriglobia bacterium]
MPEFKIEGESVNFWLRVKPRATRERLTVDASGELRLELHAPATEGKANEACIHFLARALRLPQASVEILSGQKARRKLLRVKGRSPEESIAGIKKAVTGDGQTKFETGNSRIVASFRVSNF